MLNQQVTLGLSGPKNGDLQKWKVWGYDSLNMRNEEDKGGPHCLVSTYCVPGILIVVVMPHYVCGAGSGSTELSVFIKYSLTFKNQEQTKSHYG